MSKLLDNKLTLKDKEMILLRNSIDKSKLKTGKKIVQSDEIQYMIEILEKFLRNKKLICYGGTAINNILPVEYQFYDKKIEIPDYDFFSKTALDDAKELANIYFKNGFQDVEAKAGVHEGTFKVFVNFIPIADITYLDPVIFNNLLKNSLKVNGIHYSPPNFLRMAMYLELSRPEGDVSRWEKVLTRLTLLNKQFPLENKVCSENDFFKNYQKLTADIDVQDIVKNSLIDQGVVFFGALAFSLYSKYLPQKKGKIMRNQVRFDVLSNDPKSCYLIVKERLNTYGYKDVKIVKHNATDDVLGTHFEVIINGETMCMIFKAIACYSYNKIKLNNRTVKVASIETILSFYLLFIYLDKEYFDEKRLLCMAEYIFKIQKKDKLKNKGILKRFSINCYGKQATLKEIRINKSKKFKELQNKRHTKEWNKHFLRYVPSDVEKLKSKKRTLKNKKQYSNFKNIFRLFH
tara:strand:+ start:2963 stop:4345 length:1383 start_codon:yes stop_codon:yes gene_type:complete